MHIRSKPWARPELEACRFFQANPLEHRGAWQKVFENNHPLHMEVGCGKGTFMAELGSQNPGINYITIDLIDGVLGWANRNIQTTYTKKNQPINNIQLMSWDIERIDLLIAPEDGVERIYINFCNPWPLRKHQKKRLTHPKQLRKYQALLKHHGEIHFKTDDDGLFEDSIAYFKASGFTIKTLIPDLHASDYPGNIETEHEKMYVAKGVKIKFLIAML